MALPGEFQQVEQEEASTLLSSAPHFSFLLIKSGHGLGHITSGQGPAIQELSTVQGTSFLVLSGCLSFLILNEDDKSFCLIGRLPRIQ